MLNNIYHSLYSLFNIKILALSDTIGAANPELVKNVFESIIPELKNVEFGAHLHTTPEDAISLTEAAFLGGCRRFDGAIKGYGGCPMAKDDLTGNMPTEKMVSWFSQNNVATGLNDSAFNKALIESAGIFA